MKIIGIKKYVASLYYYVRWSWRFYSFGWMSRVHCCDMLTNPKAISIGKNVLIRKGARLEAVGNWDGKRPKIIIGDGTKIQFYFHCGAAESVIIGNDVLIGGRVYITDHDHVYDDPQLPAVQNWRVKSKPVIIEKGAYLGEGAVILKGVTIGERAVVGANSVVTKDVPPYTIVAGVPARNIRSVPTPTDE